MALNAPDLIATAYMPKQSIYFLLQSHRPIGDMAYMAEFLSDADNPTERIRCPIHGFIRYSKNERSIIDHPVFQRLRHIRQLAMTYLVYPGAMHSRFEHSLGVMDLASRAFDAVCSKKEQEVKRALAVATELEDKTLAKGRQIVRLMGLLHDAGHPAFSHAAESTIPTGDHENVSIYVVKEILRDQIDSVFFPGASDLLARLISKSPELRFLREFVSSQMDMDRTDYLRRDSLHCGVDYGVFDHQRMVDSLTAAENPDSGEIQLAFERGGEHAFEGLIIARYQMSTQVYGHRIRRIYDYYLTEYMKLWGPENYQSFDQVLSFDDVSVLLQIRSDIDHDVRGQWAKRIVERKHHRVVHESGDNADADGLNVAKRIHRRLRDEFSDFSFILDSPTLGIHKLRVQGDQDESATEELFIVEKNGRLKSLAKDSPIIGTIPKSVRSVRIFVDAPPPNLKEIRSRAKELESIV